MIDTGWLTTTKPTFQDEWLALPPKESHQVLEKIVYLRKDPRPDGNLKKQLTHIDRRLHRLESGDYRIFYTFDHPYISLLALRRRREDTYGEDFRSEYLGGLDPQLEEFFASSRSQQPRQEDVKPAPAPGRRYPEPLTKELLVNLLIPAEYHPRLLQTHTEEELYECAGVPDELKLKLATHMFEKPLVLVVQEKDYLLPEINDLMRFKSGELLGFLLKLSPEQEKYVSWGLQATGPTLLKGGPGTGKSTIAIYRVRALVQDLKKQGEQDFQILFTTYTNALVRSSEQLLEQLLGADSRYVQVCTVDKVVHTIAGQIDQLKTLLMDQELDDLLLRAQKEVVFEGTPAHQRTQRQLIECLSYDYLRQEILQVIVANQLDTLEQYLAAPRSGRKLALSKQQRQAVWLVYKTLQRILDREGKETFAHLRSRTERALADGRAHLQYDAVIVDEAQDLEPSALRLLVRVCKSLARLFITADANQSIYGSHFSWSQVHDELQFRGRTAVLHANYRSTQEIGEAAQVYLVQGLLDDEQVRRLYVNSGSLPVMRRVFNEQDEVQLLASFLTAAARTYRLNIDACAILCPSEKAGRSLAAALSRYELDAIFMSGHDLDLEQPGIKILTLNSAKGLEFPIVALAGFQKSSTYMQKPTHTSDEEREEKLGESRRLLFVGMTRAMRALLVVVPARSLSPLLTTGFDQKYWNLEEMA